MDIYQVVKELAAGGFATFLVAVLVAGKYRVWIWGHHYDAMVIEKDERFDEMVREKDAQITYERGEKDQWRALAWDTHKLTERSVSLATKAVQP